MKRQLFTLRTICLRETWFQLVHIVITIITVTKCARDEFHCEYMLNCQIKFVDHQLFYVLMIF